MTSEPDGRPQGASETAPLGATAQWTVVAVLLLNLVVIPPVILFWPPTFLPFHDAYLALALVPGLVLGGVAVVLAVRARG